MDVVGQAQSFLGMAFSQQVTQFGLAFGFAALIHAHQVKKEIAAQMGSIVKSIDDVARALREDLSKQSNRLEKVEDGVNKLNTRVEKLEIKKE